jgi:predicted RNA binding protein YcfA (HicA-like mRNA interferase family)
MAGIEKLIEKMRNRPNGIRYEEAVKVLKHIGYELDRVRGSHHQFRNAKGNLTTIKYANPLDAVYVKDILKRLGS